MAEAAGDSAQHGDIDVAIVGAGIIGIAAASFLQDEGRDVLLIDRGEPAQGASFGNAGAFAFSDILPLASPRIMRKAPRWLIDPLGPLSIPPAYLPEILPWLIRFWRASWPDRVRGAMVAQAALMRLASREMAALVAAAGLDGMVRSDGSLELYEREAELTAAMPGWDARAQEGIAFQHVRGAAMADLQPGLSPRFVAGTFVPGWKTVSDPYDFARALAARLVRRGGRIARHEVAAIRPVAGGVALDCRDGSSIMARQAVIACGAWSRSLARALGDDVPLETERGYNTTLPPGAFDIRRQLIFGGHGFVITPLSSGIRVGGAVELGGLARGPNFARSEAMLRKAAGFLPGLKTDGGRQWMGFRPSLPDSLPVIGASRASADIVYAFGHGHLGLTQSAATGRLVADLVAGRAPVLDIARFSPQRF
ncbi:NAD(P)/FAD-dependent oxidoreductase [Chelatococcus asaccharovorans]|uniref:NAD(P)/FAD-dependent oxidoreductase n=1 Tax=Chelatococcus asaccharovorans TaxID=28210 RepID=UPI00224C7BCD|nr:FAD-dependent oxidoreductase [Chelatococcus asaccharovorans]CAH1667710.1 D-amino acid dehydrogenase small subunit [Chelatococcus asaccharovorans]CAH1680721.1 D-amino acid dehydrogenase small subunit [Chelatococcus asaccharovorans]